MHCTNSLASFLHVCVYMYSAINHRNYHASFEMMGIVAQAIPNKASDQAWVSIPSCLEVRCRHPCPGAWIEDLICFHVALFLFMNFDCWYTNISELEDDAVVQVYSVLPFFLTNKISFLTSMRGTHASLFQGTHFRGIIRKGILTHDLKS